MNKSLIKSAFTSRSTPFAILFTYGSNAVSKLSRI